MPPSKRPAKPDKMQVLIVDQMVNTIEPFVAGWLQTLGEAGKPQSKVAPHIRVKAAMDGLNFYMKLQDIQSEGAGANDLLAALTQLENGANDVGQEFDGGAETYRSPDTEHSTEDFPLE